MGSNVVISAVAFAAFLRCPIKGLLIARGKDPPDKFFDDVGRRVALAYKSRLSDFSLVRFTDLPAGPQAGVSTVFVDAETAFYVKGASPAAGAINLSKRARPLNECVPVLCSSSERTEPTDHLIVAFCALAIEQRTRSLAPTTGRIVCGDAQRIRTIKVAELLQKTRQIIESIEQADDNEPSQVILNKHCPSCGFQPRCYRIATDHEDLSLLNLMSAKERAKCIEKGITTITQLSYGYRPRRRRKQAATAAPRGNLHFKHDHKLKALAVKKAQIHVVGSPAFSIDGTSVFVDVEGRPDNEFYYLIGVRYQWHGRYVERSLWADRPEDEFRIWQECLRILKRVENPRLVHYGAYESRFLRSMKTRWDLEQNDAEFVDQLIDGSVNLISQMYGKIYFPTYSNSLKEIARWLGFDWTWKQASGTGAALLRRCWELDPHRDLRQRLIEYNIEDCRATEVVANAISAISSGGGLACPTKLDLVDVASLEVGFQRTYGKFSAKFPEFEKINSAAYWDYQRSKVYVRTDKTVRRTVERATRPTAKVAVDKEVVVEDKPALCPQCDSPTIWVARRANNVLLDLKFAQGGIKRWAVRYRYNRYRCAVCRAEMTPHVVGSKYGPNLRAYAVYLLIEMRLSNLKISEHIRTVFGLTVLHSMVNHIKRNMAKKYEPTYRSILRQIAGGSVVHADETKGVVYGGGHYVWVFANWTSVAYVYSESRDASTLGDILGEFKGVLVSDFYGGYDSVPCQQQRCLIHLMRDINEDVVKHPFNEELTFIASRFGSLLRDIVQTIDRFGLKKFHLKKHKRSANRFLDDISARHCSTEAGSALKKRIEKNRDRLFTFLDHDGVPWNNNNAEHAVRAFTRLRNVMITSTPRGTTDYCVLLSMQQTLRSRGMGFLDFLRSGRTDIEEQNKRRSVLRVAAAD
jgi:predicted RecB family nuclease